MNRIKDFASRFGLSVRTMHYYDKIGLLTPAYVDDNKQRWYGDKEGQLLEQILRYKEMDFSLADIRSFIEKGRSDTEDLMKQRDILMAKIRRIENSVSKLDELIVNNGGGKGMNIENKQTFGVDAYDRLREEYRQEAKERYGDGEAYRQSEERTKNYTKQDWNKVQDETADILKSFHSALNEGKLPEEVSVLVEEWRMFISTNFYDCTLEMLDGLSDLYLADERFKKNLDGYGEGTAEYVSKAIKAYVAGQ